VGVVVVVVGMGTGTIVGLYVIIGAFVGVGVGTPIGALVILDGTGAFVGVDVDGTGTWAGLDIGTIVGVCGLLFCGGALIVGVCVDIGAFVVLLVLPCVVGNAVGALEVGGGGGGITSGLLGDSVGIMIGSSVGAFVLFVFIGAAVGDNDADIELVRWLPFTVFGTTPTTATM
jgi:hypothetical protein